PTATLVIYPLSLHDALPICYGISSWTVDGHNYIGHAGGMVGYSSQLHGDMDDGLGVIALVNFPGGPGDIPDYALKLLRAVYAGRDRKSTRLNSSHLGISYAV